jgi:hypothetical protein
VVDVKRNRSPEPVRLADREIGVIRNPQEGIGPGGVTRVADGASAAVEAERHPISAGRVADRDTHDGLPVCVDDRLNASRIVFNAGSHRQTMMMMALNDFLDAVRPIRADVASA